MEFLGILIVVGLVMWAASKAAGSDSARGTEPDFEVKITTSGGFSDSNEVDVQKTSEGVVFNPDGSFPVNLHGVYPDDLSDFLDRFRNRENPRLLKDHLGLLIAQKNAESPEVEQFLNQVQSRYEKALSNALAKEPDYEDWPAADRDDFIDEARDEAVDALEICTVYEDIPTLMHDRPSDVTADDALTRKFEGDSEAFRRYTEIVKRKKPVEPYNREDRQVLERLADMGLVLRGADLPIENLLQGLRMKDIQRLMGEDAPKTFRRKAEAIDHAKELPDIRERVGEEIPLRSTYQVIDPPEEYEAAAAAFRYATQYAGLIITTLITEAQTARQVERGKKFEVAGDECFLCNTYIDKEITPRAKKARPPHHPGCTCFLDTVEF